MRVETAPDNERTMREYKKKMFSTKVKFECVNKDCSGPRVQRGGKRKWTTAHGNCEFIYKMFKGNNGSKSVKVRALIYV